MLRDGKADVLSGLDHDNVATPLSIDTPTAVFQYPNRFGPGNNRKFGHYRLTSTSRMATVKGMPCAARTSRHPRIASAMF